mmetsp:Transcript_13921/g.37955  ORF Transcript_13921/g.37955 Transcript_13921/m.37955 type:complete len:209 (-) Transcript_13921:58-684(-)
MTNGKPAMGWLKSSRASVSFTSTTIAAMGPLGPCNSSCAPTSTPSGRRSIGSATTLSSSRSAMPISPCSDNTLVSPTVMPCTPTSKPGKTWPRPQMKSKGCWPSEESRTSPVSSLTSLNSTSTYEPSSAMDGSALPASAAARGARSDSGDRPRTPAKKDGADESSRATPPPSRAQTPATATAATRGLRPPSKRRVAAMVPLMHNGGKL